MPSQEYYAYHADIKENYDKTGWWFQIERHGTVVYVSNPWTELSPTKEQAIFLSDMVTHDLIMKRK